MTKENNVFNYVKKLSRKWWILLAFVPSVLGLFNFYFGLPAIILSWQVGLVLFSILFVIANYLVWHEEYKEKVKLENRIKEHEDKKPKLSLSLENDKKNFTLKNKIFERVLDESPGIKVIDNPNILKRMTEKILGLEDSPVIDEIYEAFLPVKFELHNDGEFVATDVLVDIEFPDELVLIESLPNKGGLFTRINLSPNRSYGRFFQEKNKLRLWCQKSQPPYSMSFEEVYIFSSKTKKFKIKYEIHSDELGSKGIKGGLVIDAKPVKEQRKYTMERELDRDDFEYKKIVDSKLQEAIA